MAHLIYMNIIWILFDSNNLPHILDEISNQRIINLLWTSLWNMNP